jgi:hypothetical protein
MKIFIADTMPKQPVIDILSDAYPGVDNPTLFSINNSIVPLEKSDAVLIPHDAHEFASNYNYMKYIDELSKKKLIIFSDRSDFPICPKIKNSISLRVAINPGEGIWNKIVIPYNIESLSHLPLRQYHSEPSINFTGFVPRITSPRRFLKSLKRGPQNIVIGNSSIVRFLAINKCKKQLKNFSFTIRNKYFKSTKDYQQRSVDRKEYINNMSVSDIILAPRGDANQSQRFYEALSSGRIVLLPNSKIVFPSIYLKSEIMKISLILFNLNEVSLNKRINDFWGEIENDSNYYLRQKQIKKFFNEELRFDVFMKKLFSYNIDYIKILSAYREI